MSYIDDDSHLDDDFAGAPVSSESDELVSRLRDLEWPEVRSEVAERCWADFTSRLEHGADDGEGPRPGRSDRNVGHRLDYTRHVAPLRTAMAPYKRTPTLEGRAGVRTPAAIR